MTSDLWTPVVRRLAEIGVASDVWGQDAPRIDETLAELYVLGARPTPAEARAALATAGVSGRWADAVIQRWQKRCGDPAWWPRHLRRQDVPLWVLPFHWPDVVATEQGLRSVDERLVDATAAATADLLQVSRVAPGSAEAVRAEKMYLLTTGAARLRALAADAADGVRWPSIMAAAVRPRNRGLDAAWTKTGRQRERDRSDCYVAEREAVDRASRRADNRPSDNPG